MLCFFGWISLSAEELLQTDSIQRAYTFSARENPEDFGVNVSADFVYWTLREEGLAYAASGIGANAAQGKIHEPEWVFRPGLKVGVALDLPRDGWDLSLNYTWISTKAKGEMTREESGSTIIGYYAVNGQQETLNEARANWFVNLNEASLVLGRETELSPYFNIRPYGGVTTGWINQDYDVRYVTESDQYQKIHLSQNYWGIGLKAGLESSYFLFNDFSLFCDLDVAVLWSLFKVSRKERVETITMMNTIGQTHAFEPDISIEMGFRYETHFGKEGKYSFLVQASWENIIRILQNQLLLRMPETYHSGDMFSQGLTLKVCFGF